MASKGFQQCSQCAQLNDVELCFECNHPLCAHCLNNHYNEWRAKAVHSSSNAERNLLMCKHKLDILGPLFYKNQSAILNAQEKIEKAYNAQLQKLNDEKAALTKTINDLRTENNKINEFQSKVESALQVFNELRDPNERYDRRTAMGLHKKIEDNLSEASKLTTDFDMFKSSTMKVLDKFEETPSITVQSGSSIGKLVVNNQHINSYEPPRPVSMAPSSMMLNTNQGFPNVRHSAAPSIPLNAFTDTTQSHLKRWKERLESANTATQDYELKEMPLHSCSYKNSLFVLMGNKEKLIVYESTTADYFKEVNVVKMAMVGANTATAIAVNADYLAVAYVKDPKSKQQKHAGVMLFNLLDNRHHVQASKIEKVLSLSNQEFIKPKGLALNESYAFVCDFELRIICKYDLKTGTQVLMYNKFAATDKPYKIAVNQNYAVVTEMGNHQVCLFDVGTLALRAQKTIGGGGSSEDAFGPFDVYITNDNLIIAKTYWTRQLILMDAKLDTHFVFNMHKDIAILSFTMLECQPPILAIGNCDKKYMKMSLFS